MHLSPDKHAELEHVAYEIRRLSVEMITYGRWGHIGGSFSLAEVLAVLYFEHMRHDSQRPTWEGRDRLVLSKAHASPALYAVLALAGYYPVEKVYTYCELGGLEGHTDMTRTPGLESSGGPLGMGLSVAVGIAMGLRRKDLPSARAFCILGDGETNEGNVWEAAMAAAHYHLDNLIAVIDYNKVMAKGFVWDLMSIEPYADKWRAFGWDVLELDGHDILEVAQALYKARWVMPRGKPIVIIAHTVKGRGVEQAEFNYKWHTHAPNPATADAMLRELAARYGRPIQGYSRLSGSNEAGKETFYAENKHSNGTADSFATLEMRDAFGETLVALGRDYSTMLVLDADLHTSSKTEYFKQAYPDRFIQGLSSKRTKTLIHVYGYSSFRSRGSRPRRSVVWRGRRWPWRAASCMLK